MKQLVLACLLGMFALAVQAAPALSCEEVNEVGEALTGLGVALDDENAEIGEGSDEDAALGETVIGLAAIAEAEEDEDLANASVAMANAWEANDRGAFVDALADAVVKLAVVSASECE